MKNTSRAFPLDHPYSDRPHRVYAALTNHCNRSCPWCSTCSSPSGSTWLKLDDFMKSLPKEGAFEVQLEGGEPLIHPEFDEFVKVVRNNPRCKRVIICTNGTLLPRQKEKLIVWVLDQGEPLTLKMSINHHLIERDRGLIRLGKLLRRVFDEIKGERLLVFNVRLRKGTERDDLWVTEAVEKAGLKEYANVFFLQRYGFASNQMNWESPFLAGTNFSMVNPDGTAFGPDLVARSEAMRRLN